MAGENAPRIPGACATRNFYASGKRPIDVISLQAIYYLRFPGASEVKISAKWATDFDYYSADGGEWVPNKWLHLIFTWKAGDGIRAYLNGCDMDPDDSKDYAYSRSRSEDATHTFPFLVGSGIEDWEDRDGTTIDELYIWYEKLSPIQIWQFYIQGGTIQ